MKILTIVLALTFSAGAAASSTYTKNELNSMAASGHYPEQEATGVRSSEYLSFGDCKSSAYGVYIQVADNYPAEIIVDTTVMYVIKVWTNDGAIIVSCSRSDSKKIITQSAYK